MSSKLRLGVAGPVGSGKTALVEALCRRLRDDLQLAVVTNDIYTQEDAQFLTRAGALDPERIRGVETGGCPHTAIREDCSINRAAVAELEAQFPDLDLVLVESGGDNLAASFSPELVDLCIYVIDVAAGDKIPRKGGPGITRSDLLVINKIDLAPQVGADLSVMEQDTLRMRGKRPWCFTNLQSGEGLEQVVGFLLQHLCSGGTQRQQPHRGTELVGNPAVEVPIHHVSRWNRQAHSGPGPGRWPAQGHRFRQVLTHVRHQLQQRHPHLTLLSSQLRGFTGGQQPTIQIDQTRLGRNISLG